MLEPIVAQGPLLVDIASQLPDGLKSSFWTFCAVGVIKFVADGLQLYKQRR